MDLINQAVTHKVFGEGVITGQDARHVTVSFGDGSSKQFAYPGSFGQFLTLADSGLQAAVASEAANSAAARPSAQQEVLRRVEERARLAASRRAVSAPAPSAPAAPAAPAGKQRPSTKRTSSPKAPGKASSHSRGSRGGVRASQVVVGATAVSRAAGVTSAFVAFQGPSHAAQVTGGYLWAPLETADGNKVRSWDRLAELRPGDIVLACDEESLRAVGRVMALWSKTSDLDGARRYGRPGCMGRRVDCTYVALENPVPMDGFRGEVVGDEEADPSDGGFLFEPSPELAHLMLEEAAELNPAVARSAFVRRYLEG